MKMPRLTDLICLLAVAEESPGLNRQPIKALILTGNVRDDEKTGKRLAVRLTLRTKQEHMVAHTERRMQ
jgi:hypothetical protein